MEIFTSTGTIVNYSLDIVVSDVKFDFLEGAIGFAR